MAHLMWDSDDPVGFKRCSEVLCVAVEYDGPEAGGLFEVQKDVWVDRFLVMNKAVSAQLRAEEGVLKGREAEVKERLLKIGHVKVGGRLSFMLRNLVD